jgi:hypothetical protein
MRRLDYTRCESLRKSLRISRRDLQLVGAFAIVATIVASIGAYAYLNPPASDEFLAMWVLGANGLAEHYYPNDNPNLKPSENVNWTLGVYNHMGRIEYIVVRVKLLNSTLPSPDGVTGTPSPTSPLLEMRRILVDNETWSLPFSWEILALAKKGQSLSITGMVIQQMPFEGTLASTVSGSQFRFVFELWFFDESSNDLAFSWQSMGVQHAVWTQIWFNATQT